MPAALEHMTVHEPGELLRTRAISARELPGAVFAGIEATAARTNSFIALCRESAGQQAREAGRCIAEGSCGPLSGRPSRRTCLNSPEETCS